MSIYINLTHEPCSITRVLIGELVDDKSNQLSPYLPSMLIKMGPIKPRTPHQHQKDCHRLRRRLTIAHHNGSLENALQGRKILVDML